MIKALRCFLDEAGYFLIVHARFILWVPLGIAVAAVLQGLTTKGEGEQQ